jgi:hypothetical protein
VLQLQSVPKLPHPEFTMPHDPISAADGFVLAMLAVMALSFGTVGLAIGCGLRNAARRNADVDNLLEEVAAEEQQETRKPVGARDKVRLEPWERDGDWWKK